MARALRFDPRKMFREDGSLKTLPELDADTADALAGFEVVEMAGGMKVSTKDDGNGGTPALQHVPMYTKKVKWLDKNTARDQAAKVHGLYEKDNEQAAKALMKFIYAPGKSPRRRVALLR
jgi:phage terminase small subunit